MKDYEFMISQFVDNELSASEQRELFLFLSESEEGRETLSDYMRMKNETKLFYTGINPELNEPKIFAMNVSSKDKIEKKYKKWFYYSVAASIIFALLFLSNFMKENVFSVKYQNLKTEFVHLQEKYNSMLNEKVELIKMNKSLTKEKNIFKLKYAEAARQSKKDIAKKVKAKIRNACKMGNEYLSILAEIPTIKITEEDYLVR